MKTGIPTYSLRQIWIMAIRPKTLPAAAAPVIVAGAIAFYEDTFQPLVVIAALVTALLLQIGANLANDAFDFLKGSDTQKRLGPLRVTQAGLLTPRQVFIGMWTVFGLATLSGLYLVWQGGLPILILGVAAILSAIAYTGGPFPLGYLGLGDLFVFIFFGFAAVAGTYYIQAHFVSALAWWGSVPMGFLIVAILVVNNLRDIDTDRISNKLTLAVRLGRSGAQIEYIALLVGSYLCPVLMAVTQLTSWWVMLSWLSIPLSVRLVRSILTQQGKPLNTALAGTGQLTLMFGLLLSIGLVLGKLVT